MSETAGRRPWGLLGAGVALVVVFAAVRLTTDPPPPDHADPAPPTAADPALFDVPTRGTLAGDDTWVDGVAASDALADLPAERHVALATEAPEERIALVLGRAAGAVQAAWLTGDPGAAPADMTLAAPVYEVTGREPQALWDVPDFSWTGGVLVLVAPPGTGATFAHGRDVAADGTEGFSAASLPVTDGVAVAPVGPPVATTGSLVMVQHGRDGYAITPVLSDRALRAAGKPIDPADPRGLRGAVDEALLQSALHDMAGAYGLLPDVISPVLLAAGPVGDSGDGSVLVGATLPTGATVAWLAVAGAGPAAADGGALVRTVSTVPAPAGRAIGDQVLAVPAGWAVSHLPIPRADAPPGWLVLSGPRAGTTAELLSAGGDVLAVVPLVDGAGTAPAPQGTSGVRVRDAGGNALGEGAVTPLAD